MTYLLITLTAITGIGLGITLLSFLQAKKSRDQLLRLDTHFEHLSTQLTQVTTQLHEGQVTHWQKLQESLQQGLQHSRQQLTETLSHSIKQFSEQTDKLTQMTEQRLKEISGQVDKRLHEGFEKTTATFTDVIKRLALIDEAQKKITELSSNVVNLQSLLDDKRTRGAFGEVQLTALLRNVMPESNFSLQHTLSNGKRVDCLLFLPEPTGHIAIDAKFPLENYRRLTDSSVSSSERQLAAQQFRSDIKHHIQSIAEKYIIAGETSDGAVMFIPAEAVFAEIHAHYPDLIETAYKAKVWLVSPTTMMAILTTARAVLKDAATRKQVHIIQQHLGMLSKDFDRFQKRMENLARHIDQAHTDINDVSTSAKKITRRFEKIEQVELDPPHLMPPEELDILP